MNKNSIYFLFITLFLFFVSCTNNERNTTQFQDLSNKKYSPPEWDVEFESKYLGIPVSVNSSLEDIPESELYLTHYFSYLDIPFPIVYSTNIESDKDCFVIKMKVTQNDSLIHKKTLVNRQLKRHRDEQGIAKMKSKLFFSIKKSKSKKFYEYTLFERTISTYKMTRDSFEVRPDVYKGAERGIGRRFFLTPNRDSILIFHTTYGPINYDIGSAEDEFKVIIYAKII